MNNVKTESNDSGREHFTNRNSREVAWHVLCRVDSDRAFADLTLHAALRDSEMDRRDRALATELAYGALRTRGRLDTALRQCLDRDMKDVEVKVRNVLRLGAYQLLFMRKISDPVGVAETVKLAKSIGRERAAGFVNAVLRQMVRGKTQLKFASLSEDPREHLIQWGSLPPWLAERCIDELGVEDAAAFAEVCLTTPPRSIRVTDKGDVDEIAKRLRGRRCTYAPRGIAALEMDPIRDSAFDHGEITVQDEASQLVALLLDAQPGETIVDTCAAPGTKTVQIAERVGPKGEVIALDIQSERLRLIGGAARRLGVSNIRMQERDSSKSFDLQGRVYFGKILVDAPCSGLGTLRRNPDLRWRATAREIERLADLQFDILRTAARHVDRDGVLVYSVCTFTREETSGVIRRFLDKHRDFKVDDPRPILPESVHPLVEEDFSIRTWPHRDGCDGFYAVRLVRT